MIELCVENTINHSIFSDLRKMPLFFSFRYILWLAACQKSDLPVLQLNCQLHWKCFCSFVKLHLVCIWGYGLPKRKTPQPKVFFFDYISAIINSVTSVTSFCVSLCVSDSVCWCMRVCLCVCVSKLFINNWNRILPKCSSGIKELHAYYVSLSIFLLKLKEIVTCFIKV